MTEILRTLRTIINDNALDEKELIHRLKSVVFDNELASYQASESKSLLDLYAENISGWQESAGGGELIKSGFNNLDALIGGFSPGEFVVIGGRPAMGKTQLCVNLALNISKNQPVLYFTFDLSEHLLTSRFLAAITGISASRILQHDLSGDELLRVTSLKEQLQQYRVSFNDSCNSSLPAFRSHCIRQIEENGIKIIMVDYLQLMSSNRYRNSRELEISYITRELKTLARDHQVCVIATSQLSRAVESRSMAGLPKLSDLRDSGAIEQDADKVIFIYRPEYYNIDVDEQGNNTEGLTELIVAKNRNGAVGSAKLMRNGIFSSFTDYVEPVNEFTFSRGRMDEIENAPF
jgi:replicative DNA helicase